MENEITIVAEFQAIHNIDESQFELWMTNAGIKSKLVTLTYQNIIDQLHDMAKNYFQSIDEFYNKVINENQDD